MQRPNAELLIPAVKECFYFPIQSYQSAHDIKAFANFLQRMSKSLSAIEDTEDIKFCELALVDLNEANLIGQKIIILFIPVSGF